MPIRLTGLIAAPHTPLARDGALLVERVEDQARRLAAWDVAGVFVAGSTGEGLSLTVPERLALAESWGRVGPRHGLRVVVHCGHESLPEAEHLAAHAAQIGADAIAVTPPRYFKPATLDDLVDWCVRVASVVPELPFYYYDIPVLTGVAFSMHAFLEAAAPRVPALAGLKYTNTDMLEFQRCLHFGGGRYDVLWGTDEAMLAGLAFGARGFVGSTYNFAAPLYHRLRSAFEAGDLDRARREQMRSVELVVKLASYDFLPAAKAVMGMLGVDCGGPRAPFKPLAPERQRALREELASMGFFAWIETMVPAAESG
ncbi:MAG: hypothetical protein GY711_19040 [bacterium]|nr:hypothetical protein [bacterium]